MNTVQRSKPASLVSTASESGADGTSSKGEKRLVIVSNRVPPPSSVGSNEPQKEAPVGGLVSALIPTIEEQGGLWFGWSGRTTQRRPDVSAPVSRIGLVELATIDLAEEEASLYYTGFANRTLWPLLHSFPERVVIRSDTYRAYRRINRRFAEALYPMLAEGDLVWVHDFHLFHLGEELRQLGWGGKIGLYLHVQFPPADIFAILPWSRQILEACLSYDLVGLQTERYLHNLIDSLGQGLGVSLHDGVFTRDDASLRLGVYPIGIDPAVFQQPSSESARGLAEHLSIPTSPGHRLILGVDRLDYTKGIPERLRAFERLLDHNPSLRGRVTFVQISTPSRTRVPEYIQEKEQVDRLVGHINGRYSEGGWVPIRYLFRTYPQHQLARFYRDADVCLVTPLRDGMNLVAKEFVAAQRYDPGVLVLSSFAGAAAVMPEALLVNPYDIEATAGAIHEALRMPAAERRQRWITLSEEVWKNTAYSWSEALRTDLADA